MYPKVYILHVIYTPIMAINGITTSFYLQKDLEEGIADAVLYHADTFKSRNHLINCAISRELRRINEIDESNRIKEGNKKLEKTWEKIDKLYGALKKISFN